MEETFTEANTSENSRGSIKQQSGLVATQLVGDGSRVGGCAYRFRLDSYPTCCLHD
jgi:hypothetical protein